MRRLLGREEEFVLEYPASLRKEWREEKRGEELIRKYFACYEGCLFDCGNLTNALGQHEFGWHFAEWWTAIQLYQKYQLLSLVGKYAGRYPIADQKLRQWRLRRFQEVIPDKKKQDFLRNGRLSSASRDKRLIKLPDLLVYTPDKRNYAFVEVKGPGDSLKPEQRKSFDRIKKCLERDVYIARLREA